MVKCGVFFAVRTEFLNIIQTSFGFKGSAFVEGNCENLKSHHRLTVNHQDELT
jgi:hypothetical protein